MKPRRRQRRGVAHEPASFQRRDRSRVSCTPSNANAARWCSPAASSRDACASVAARERVKPPPTKAAKKSLGIGPSVDANSVRAAPAKSPRNTAAHATRSAARNAPEPGTDASESRRCAAPTTPEASAEPRPHPGRPSPGAPPPPPRPAAARLHLQKAHRLRPAEKQPEALGADPARFASEGGEGLPRAEVPRRRARGRRGSARARRRLRDPRRCPPGCFPTRGA